MPAFALTTTRALRALVPLFTVTARPGIALAGLGAVVLAVSTAQVARARTAWERWETATGPLASAALRGLVRLFTVTARPGIALAGLGAVVLAVSKAQAAPASTGREPWATATGPLVGPPLPPVGFGVEPPGPVVLAGGGGTTTIGGA